MTNLLSKLKQGVQQATTTSSSTGTNAAATATATAYSASHPPRYVYKLLDATNPRFTGFPVPIPSSWQVPVTELDAKDGFMHLSTEQQIQGTLDRFFNPTKGLNRVTVLKMEYDRLSAWKVVKWEHSGSGGLYPHLYAQLSGDMIDSFREIAASSHDNTPPNDKDELDNDGEGKWASSVKSLRDEGWLV